MNRLLIMLIVLSSLGCEKKLTRKERGWYIEKYRLQVEAKRKKRREARND